MVLLTQHECVGNGGRLTAGLLAKARAQKHLKGPHIDCEALEGIRMNKLDPTSTRG